MLYLYRQYEDNQSIENEYFRCFSTSKEAGEYLRMNVELTLMIDWEKLISEDSPYKLADDEQITEDHVILQNGKGLTHFMITEVQHEPENFEKDYADLLARFQQYVKNDYKASGDPAYVKQALEEAGLSRGDLRKYGLDWMVPDDDEEGLDHE